MYVYHQVYALLFIYIYIYIYKCIGLLSRVMRPNLLLQMVLSDGRIKIFEVSMEQYNQLRYSVAKVLHDMQGLSRHPIMKVINEIERKDYEDRQK